MLMMNPLRHCVYHPAQWIKYSSKFERVAGLSRNRRLHQLRTFCEKSTPKTPKSLARAGKPRYGMRILLVSSAIGGGFAYVYGIPPEVEKFVKENIEMIVCL